MSPQNGVHQAYEYDRRQNDKRLGDLEGHFDALKTAVTVEVGEIKQDIKQVEMQLQQVLNRVNSTPSWFYVTVVLILLVLVGLEVLSLTGES